MFFEKISYKLGRTQEKTPKLSDIIGVFGVVESKSFLEKDDFELVQVYPTMLDFCTGKVIRYKPKTIPVKIGVKDVPVIKIKGKEAILEVEDNLQLFKELNVGDRVVFDYIPPNFSEKQLIMSTPISYEFVGAKKII